MSSMPSGDCNKRPAPDAAAVIDFWFGDPTDADNVDHRGGMWFSPTEAQDRALRERFRSLHARAERGDLDGWRGEPGTVLALVLLLDQFTRNLYRGAASAFANDARALAIAQEGVKRGFDRSMHFVERAFFYMPFQHSEKLEVQRRSARLFKTLLESSPESFRSFAENSYEHAVLHCDIVERFGRFPHRNESLGRRSTGPEKQYLEQGGHRFGQG
ncbi:MAG: hypothetical protein MAG794_00539 [Gammaproteobacteria bacterium]|nr:hypothetical protein [Gammaproteobacteria bacterium]